MRARAGRAASGRRGSCLSSRKIDTPLSLTINLWAVFKRFKYLNGRVTGPVTGCTNVRATRPGTTKREAIIQREAPCIMYTYTLACCVRGFSLYWFLNKAETRAAAQKPPRRTLLGQAPKSDAAGRTSGSPLPVRVRPRDGEVAFDAWRRDKKVYAIYARSGPPHRGRWRPTGAPRPRRRTV